MASAMGLELVLLQTPSAIPLEGMHHQQMPTQLWSRPLLKPRFMLVIWLAFSPGRLRWSYRQPDGGNSQENTGEVEGNCQPLSPAGAEHE